MLFSPSRAHHRLDYGLPVFCLGDSPLTGLPASGFSCQSVLQWDLCTRQVRQDHFPALNSSVALHDPQQRICDLGLVSNVFKICQVWAPDDL